MGTHRQIAFGNFTRSIQAQFGVPNRLQEA